jgi:putrescine transport system permease protein
MRKASWFNVGSVALGLAFLYLPIVILVIYSFNASRLVTVWGGWSTRWYVELLNDEAMLEAAWVTLRIALLSATAATVLGTLAAVALVRFGRFRGRLLFTGMIYAPLVMPEVITGLALLLLFVAVNIDRGFWTIAIAHTTLTMCFVTVVVQSRLLTFDTSLEEAAMDLGCPPVRTFLTVTLPLIAPALAGGWMLAFTLSLDDLVIASFTTGPGATTLPIRIYSEVRLGVKPEINAICTIVIVFVAIGITAASLLAKFRGAGVPRPAVLPSGEDQIIGLGRWAIAGYRRASGTGSVLAGAVAGVLSELPASSGAVAAAGGSAGWAGTAPVSRSIAERTGSRALRLRTASKIGCAAPER